MVSWRLGWGAAQAPHANRTRPAPARRTRAAPAPRPRRAAAQISSWGVAPLATLLLALCVPSLWATFALLHQYIATLSLRPNARLVDWTYLALLQGLLAAAYV